MSRVPPSCPVLGLVLLLLLLGTGCEKNDAPTPAADSAPVLSPSAPPRPSAAATPSAAPADAWFVGTWTARFEAQHYLIERTKKQGAVGAWAKDDGEKGSGPSSLELTISADRHVAGKVSGSLGELVASGQLDGDTLRVTLTPARPEDLAAFSGVLVADRKGDGFEGRLQASTGDSQTVRDAPIGLQKGAAAPPAAASAAGP